jgi:hypothetical protein
VQCQSVIVLMQVEMGDRQGSLFGGDVFELDALFVVGSPTCRTEPVHGRLDVVVAELTYLEP